MLPHHTNANPFVSPWGMPPFLNLISPTLIIDLASPNFPLNPDSNGRYRHHPSPSTRKY